MAARTLALALALFLVLALALALPLAAAQVEVNEIRVPERTAAGKPFEVHVRLANDGPARTVHLFAALYDKVEGEGPCGPATDPRFKRFTHLVQEAVELPANSVVEYPAPGERWLHRYASEDAPAQPTDAEFCVFVADASSSPVIEYEAFATTLLSVRAVNAIPVATFGWEPERPAATQDALFRASGTDADGDPLSYRWDFGHDNAGGRAVAEGADVSHFFYPEGEYVVTLFASDGLDEGRATRTVLVLPADTAPTKDGILPTPLPVVILLSALALAGILRRSS